MVSSKNFFMLFLALFIIIIGAGCGGDDGPTAATDNPVLLVSRATLNFGSEDVEKTFYVANSGDGNLTWSIASNQDWLTVSPSSGSVTTEQMTITVTVNRGGLTLGDHNATLTITPNSGSAKTVAVTMVVPSPQLHLSATSLDFGSTDNDLTFSITNIGGSTLEWSIASNQDWLTVSPNSGASTTEEDEITVSVNRTGLAYGNHSAIVTITPNEGNAQTVAVNLEFPSPQLHLSATSLEFGSTDNDLSFSITNIGGSTLEWSITSNEDWLTVSPNSGTSTTEEDEVTVTVNRGGQPSGEYNGVLTVTPNEGTAETVSVQMTVPVAILNLSESVLLFGSSENELSFSITNTGGGLLEWNVSTNRDWLTCLPLSGSTSTGASVVRVTADRSDISAGSYTGTITVSSNVGDETIVVSMSKGEMIWSFTPTTNTALDRVWDCYDDNSFSGEDYWGVASGDGHGDQTSIWCNGRGDHPDGRYDNNMDSYMRQKSDEAIDIRDYSEVTVRFWMKYKGETDYDFVRFLMLGGDSNWYYLEQWDGTDLTWKQYEFTVSNYNHAPDNFLRIGFFFNSDINNGFYGAAIDDIEVWGVE